MLATDDYRDLAGHLNVVKALLQEAHLNRALYQYLIEKKYERASSKTLPENFDMLDLKCHDYALYGIIISESTIHIETSASIFNPLAPYVHQLFSTIFPALSSHRDEE